MSKRVSLSGEHQDLEQISKHYTDVTDSVRIYYQPGHSGYDKRFRGYSAEEMKQELNRRLREIDRASALAVLSAVEAAFIIDYLQRCHMRKKDDLSRRFRRIYKKKNKRISLDEEILSAWKIEHSELLSLVGQLNGAFNYRHWLAHGRYWTPKFGGKYDFFSVYTLAEEVLDCFPFVGVN